MVAVGDAEVVALDVVEGVLLELLTKVAGVIQWHRERPAWLGVTGDGGIAGDPLVPEAARGKQFGKILIRGFVLLSRPRLTRGRPGGKYYELRGPVAGHRLDAKAGVEVGGVHREGLHEAVSAWTAWQP